MYIPEEFKKANKFVDVAIPSNASYFHRLGEVTQPSTQFTGEELARINQDKVTQIDDYARYAEEMSNKQSE